jgi:hypothetical protein
MESEFKYYAFISYKREDEKWARWLHRKLENYRLPSVIARSKPDTPKKLIPIFRDTTDIKPGVLADVLTQNLSDSRFLIVICSPKAAKSVWVGKEIKDFISFGRLNNIILFIVDGEPYSSNPDIECYHPVIKENLPEMLGVNLHENGRKWKYIKKQEAFIRVVSSLLEVSFDSLWGRQKRRIFSKIALYCMLCILFTISLSVVRIYEQKINQPFNLRISLKETSYHNPNLPFKNGIIRLCYDRDTFMSKPINNVNNPVVFNHIPGIFRDKKAKLKYEMFGYKSLDTIVKLNPKIVIPIERNSAYSIVQGYVRDKLSDKYLSDINVEIENVKCITSSNGYFSIKIPIEKQKISYEVILLKNNHKVKTQIAYPAKNEPSVMNTLYFQ